MKTPDAKTVTLAVMGIGTRTVELIELEDDKAYLVRVGERSTTIVDYKEALREFSRECRELNARYPLKRSKPP